MDVSSDNIQPLSKVEKIRKILLELINTERAYVKDITCLIERYLEPLKDENFLSNHDTQILFGNIREIVSFQKKFLKSLEEAVEQMPDFHTANECHQFKNVILATGSAFLFYANQFKLYSSFCASHSRAHKVLNADRNSPLREFLTARNPKQQHSATLESYLIKPIQRILKYPLLLDQLRQHAEYHSDEFIQLTKALRSMETVAEHINEMQKIYDEYSFIFDELTERHYVERPASKPVDLNVGELQLYGFVDWLNASDELGKMGKKSIDLISICFVFRTAVVFICMDNRKKLKKSKNSAPRASTIEAAELLCHQTLIPVAEIEVRNPLSSDSELHSWWELIHRKCEALGRPEKKYQLASSFDAKTDFLRSIRQIICDSVRRSSSGSSLTDLHPTPDQNHRKAADWLSSADKHAAQKRSSLHDGQLSHTSSCDSELINNHVHHHGNGPCTRHSMSLTETAISNDFDRLFRSVTPVQKTSTPGPGSLSGLLHHGSTTGTPAGSRSSSTVPHAAAALSRRARYANELYRPSSTSSADSMGSFASRGVTSGTSTPTTAKLLHSSCNPGSHVMASGGNLGSPVWKPRPLSVFDASLYGGDTTDALTNIDMDSSCLAAFGDYSSAMRDAKEQHVPTDDTGRKTPTDGRGQVTNAGLVSTPLGREGPEVSAPSQRSSAVTTGKANPVLFADQEATEC